MTTPEPQRPADIPPASAVAPAVAGAADGTELIHAAEANDLPTSFGVFKPVGYVMMGLPTQVLLDTLVSALHGAGWPAPGVRQFSPRETAAEFQAMIDNAGPLAGFGYEITMLRRYQALTVEGYKWLLVQAKDSERAAAAAEVARACGATLAVYYRTFTVEDLIP